MTPFLILLSPETRSSSIDILIDESSIFFSYSTLFLVPGEVRIRIIFETSMSWLPFSRARHGQARMGRVDMKDGEGQDSIFSLEEYPVLV